MSATRRLGWSLGLVVRTTPQLTAASAALTVLLAGVPLAQLLLIKQLVDAVAQLAVGVGPSDGLPREALLWAVLIGLAGLVGAGLNAAAVWVQEAFGLRLTDRIQHLIHNKSAELDLAYFETPEYHDNLHRAQREGRHRPGRIVAGLLQLARGVFSAVAVAGLLVAFEPGLVLVVAVAALPLLVVRIRHSRALLRWQRERTPNERRAAMYDWMLTHVQFAKEVRLFGIGAYVARRHEDLRRTIRDERLGLARRRAYADLAGYAGVAVATLVVLVVILQRVSEGAISLGGMVMYYQALQRLVASSEQIVTALAGLHEDGLFMNHLHEFLEQRSRISDPEAPGELDLPLREGVAFDSVRFRYPGSQDWALDSVSLTLRTGEVAALVGENGAGKTTLVKLLCRLYDPDEGRITIDGSDLRSFRVSGVRGAIGVAFQDFAKFPVSVRENIGFGAIDRLDDEAALLDAARWAGADGAISGLEKGLDTQLGRWFEAGQELSVGQWQKVALARARFRNAPILVLDEPSSALDARAEAELFKRMRQLLAGTTALLISHRFSSVAVADRIFVLKRGRLVEEGTHEELLRRGGEYAAMYNTQLSLFPRS